MNHPEFKPVKTKRLFLEDKLYSEIDWNDWDAVINAFRDQMEGWYLKPARTLRSNGHFSFALVSLCCTLIDTLSQYFSGKNDGDNITFKHFLEQHFVEFKANISSPISYKHQGKNKTLKTLSDAIYTGFRCGIIHEAHPKLFTAISGSAKIVEESSEALTLDSSGQDIPTIIVNPALFHDAVEKVFSGYILDLRSDAQLRLNFSKKFLVAYGIEIGKEP